MENQYGIGITNRYSLFLDNEDDPVQVLKTDVDKDKKKGKIAEKENRGKESDTAPSQKTASVTAPAAGVRKGIRDSNKGGNEANKPANKPNNNNGVNRPNRVPRAPGGQDQRNVKFNEEDREDRNNRKNLSRDDSAREPRPEGDMGRGGVRRPGGQFGGRPRGAPGGRGRGAPGGPPRKREFDRQSGSDKSGVKAVDKRDGAGSRNWGTYKDDIEEAGGAANPDETMEEKVENQGGTENAESSDEKPEQTEAENIEPPVEEGPKLMTLDEWKAMQQPRQKPVFNLRKAGEGEDQSQWKKMILKKKEEEQSAGEEEYEEDEQYDCPQIAGRQKQVLEIDFHFADSRRGGGGTRGAGRGGGGGRGGVVGAGGDRRDRGPRPPRNNGNNGNAGGFKNNRTGRFGNRHDAPRSQTAPKVDDVNDFPSLG